MNKTESIEWLPKPKTYDGKTYPSRRAALRAKRNAGDRSSPTLRRRGDK